SLLAGECRKSYVNVVQHLDMIAEEPDRLDEHAGVALSLQVEDDFLHHWTKPGAAGGALALEGECPVIHSERADVHGHKHRGFLCLLLVRVAVPDGSLGHAVRGEDDRQPATRFCAG